MDTFFARDCDISMTQGFTCIGTTTRRLFGCVLDLIASYFDIAIHPLIVALWGMSSFIDFKEFLLYQALSATVQTFLEIAHNSRFSLTR